MTIRKLEHYTIRCADLERTRDFYRDVLAMTVGERPAFPFKGYWLYAAATPVVHLMDRAEMEADPKMFGRKRQDADTGVLDHVAFECEALEATRRRLRNNGVAFAENATPGVMHQLFLRDPDGIHVELVFRDPADVPAAGAQAMASAPGGT